MRELTTTMLLNSPTVPEPGQDTATAVSRAIQEHPELHRQEAWVGWSEHCGTTFCAAGWTLTIHGYMSSWIRAHGDSKWDMMLDMWHLGETPKKAAELLGLSLFDAYILFYNTNNGEAAAALEWLAAGKELKWEEILEQDKLQDALHNSRKYVLE